MEPVLETTELEELLLEDALYAGAVPMGTVEDEAPVTASAVEELLEETTEETPVLIGATGVVLAPYAGGGAP